jgi:hypothetical protein
MVKQGGSETAENDVSKLVNVAQVNGLCLVTAATLRAVTVIPPPPPRRMTETRLFLKETKNMYADLFRKFQGMGQNQLRFAMNLFPTWVGSRSPDGWDQIP